MASSDEKQSDQSQTDPSTDQSSQSQPEPELKTIDPTGDRKLKHSQGGVTTRSDVLDVGVPMLPGDPREPVGPEDALGAGPTRGDYRTRLGGSDYRPHTTEPVSDAKPGEPNVRIVEQRQYADEIRDVKGKKGGVDTAR